MAINGLRFTHVAFRASDLERSIRWYEDAFGARKVFHAKQEGGRPELLFLEFAKGQFIELFTNGKTRIQESSDAIGYISEEDTGIAGYVHQRYAFVDHESVVRYIRGIDVLRATKVLPVGYQRQGQDRHEDTDETNSSNHKSPFAKFSLRSPSRIISSDWSVRIWCHPRTLLISFRCSKLSSNFFH
jgi:catechol 2,3-dioxygenase-like lactoylglutathione lyase family enzyme